MTAAVELRDVAFRYPGTPHGVEAIDLAIEPGELLVCVGPSGCGKTTLLNLIAGFLAPTRGRVLVGGRDVTTRGARERNCGIVFQSYALFPTMNVRDNVAYPLRVRGVPARERQERAERMLELTGLAGFADRLPRMLSGGQQQRVALARALVFEPQALLLDEPLSALDAATRLVMRDEIRRIQQMQGIATLLITHDQDEALSLGDRVAVLRDGRLEQVASPRALYDRPANAFVATFVGRANLIDATVEAPDRVTTPIGRLQVPPQDAAPGSRVRLLIRPERILPLGSDPSRDGADGAGRGPNLLDVTVRRDVFHGAVRHLELVPAGAARPDGTATPTIRLETSSREPISRIAVPPEAIQFLPAA
jgi:putative spermidine/putrescine transport system ATP-binding protein